ncbi:hypothetical protein K443DRAFT_44481, partial [Laccaria amethystina LaAM-08-1]
MHYQICGFTRYLLVHLLVPEFFRAKIYPNMFFAQEKKQKPQNGHRPYAPR